MDDYVAEAGGCPEVSGVEGENEEVRLCEFTVFFKDPIDDFNDVPKRILIEDVDYEVVDFVRRESRAAAHPFERGTYLVRPDSIYEGWVITARPICNRSELVAE